MSRSLFVAVAVGLLAPLASTSAFADPMVDDAIKELKRPGPRRALFFPGPTTFRAGESLAGHTIYLNRCLQGCSVMPGTLVSTISRSRSIDG